MTDSLPSPVASYCPKPSSRELPSYSAKTLLPITGRAACPVTRTRKPNGRFQGALRLARDRVPRTQQPWVDRVDRGGWASTLCAGSQTGRAPGRNLGSVTTTGVGAMASVDRLERSRIERPGAVDPRGAWPVLGHAAIKPGPRVSRATASTPALVDLGGMMQ